MITNFFTISVIGFLTLNILFQFTISIRYIQKFTFSFFNIEKNSWNPNIDRLKLAVSIIFTLFSVFLFNLIIKKDTSIFEIIIVSTCLLLLSGLVYFASNKTDENKIKIEEVEKLKFKPLTESTLNELKNKLNFEERAIINYSELLSISKGINLEKKIRWIDRIGQKSSSKSRNGDITYGFIFDLFHEYFIEDGIKNLKGEKRKELINYIVRNFTKNESEIIIKNLNKSYSDWVPKNN